MDQRGKVQKVHVPYCTDPHFLYPGHITWLLVILDTIAGTYMCSIMCLELLGAISRLAKVFLLCFDIEALPQRGTFEGVCVPMVWYSRTDREDCISCFSR